MKILGMMIAILMNVSVLGATMDAFTVSGANASKVTVFLVTGGQGPSGGYNVGKVFKRVGTFANTGSDISIPETEYKTVGWRGPSHVLVISHDQAQLSLNKYNANANSQFAEPEYVNLSDRIAPQGANTDFSQRKAIQVKKVKRSSRFDF